MRPTQFKIESLGYEVFDGFTKDENWNGWNCPYFTFEQAQKVLKTYNELRRIVGQTNTAFYDSSADAFVFSDDEEKEIFSSVAEDGQNIILSVLSAGFGSNQRNEQLNKTS